MSDETRIGDRYVTGERNEQHVTITAVDVERRIVSYAALNSETKSRWDSKTSLPVPPKWTKTGSGPVPVPQCVICKDRPAEPGLIYCPDCVEAEAEVWATFTPKQAQDKTTRLLKEAAKR
jgi:hypothetical protein